MGARKRRAQCRDVVAPEHPDGRVDDACISPPLAFAVQETTDVGQERHEFAVVPLLELRGVAAELVAELSPRMVGARLRQRLPMLLDLRALAQWHQPVSYTHLTLP